MKVNSEARKKKIVVSSIATIFLVMLYGIIFAFSNQEGEVSGGLSRMISEKCVAILKVLSHKNWSELMMQRMTTYFEHPIRKLAHFGEYAVMGILLFGMWYPWTGYENWQKMKEEKSVGRWRMIPLLLRIVIPWVFCSAVADEVHQLFVPGRYGSFADVILDTAGGCFGVFCCIFLFDRVINKRKGKKL